MTTIQSGDVSNSIAVPEKLKKYLISWMTLTDCRQYPYGIALIQQYATEGKHLYYLFSDTTKAIDITLSIPYPSLSFHFLFKGKCLSHFLHTTSAVHLKEKHYYCAALPPNQIKVTLQPGITESFQLYLAQKDIQPVLHNLEHLNQITFNSHMQNVAGTFVLNHNIENTLRKEMLTEIHPKLLPVRINTSVVHLLSHYEWQLASQYNEPVWQSKYQDVMISISKEIEEQPNRAIQTETFFAKKYAIGEVTLNRYFKLTLGTSLASYRHKQCMLKAAALLSKGKTIANISDALGYSDATNFAKAFRDYFGHPPSFYNKGKQ